ncbi:hypothetical protein [uncultured Mediterranean phage]|nr:hypothetical protein [uncultured Mediterranean phage]
MTTINQNVAGNLHLKVLLSGVFDPHRPDTDDNFLENSPEFNLSSTYRDTPGIGNYTTGAAPDHWQDTISDYVMTPTHGGAATGGKGQLTITPDNAAYGSNAVNRDSRSTTQLTVANEFELDVNNITHTFQNLTGAAPLPGMPKQSMSDPRATAQLNMLVIDLGMIREIISIQGILIDRVVHPSSTSGHHIRRQHLLDIVRTQYAFIHGLNRNKDDSWFNVNRLPALTLGPVFDRTAGNDQLYTGQEPSDDVRGTEHSGPHDTGQLFDALGKGLGRPKSSWDPTPSYKGRNRYRGLIRRLTLRNEGGRPDIWNYNFEFVVIKNELQMRMRIMNPIELLADSEEGFGE